MQCPVPNNWYVEDDWIIDDDKIRLYLEYMHHDEYAYVSKNRMKYPECVQSIIREYDTHPVQKVSKNVTLKIRELSDYDMYMADLESKKKLMLAVDEIWEEYKSCNVVGKPISYNDGLSQRISARLEAKRDEFIKKCEKTPIKLFKSYVPPSKRLAIAAEDPKLIPLRKEIEKLENEFEQLRKTVDQENVEWEQSAKYEFAIQNEMHFM